MRGDGDANGGGPVIVLVHGVGLDQTMWTGVTQALGGRVRSIAVDMAGHGVSKRLAPAALHGFVDALADDVAEIEGTITLVGFSMGAMVAAAYAAHHSEKVDGLVLMNAVHRRSQNQRDGVLARLALASTEGLAPVAEAAVSRWFSDNFRASHPDVIQAVHDRLTANDLAAYLAAYRVFATSDGEVADLLGRITCPVLALTGALDGNSTPGMSHAIAHAVPEGRVEVLDALAHGMPIEAPERVAHSLMTFYQDVSA